MTYVDSVPSFDFRRKLPENRVTKNDINRICTFSAYFDFRRKLPEKRLTKIDIGRICTFVGVLSRVAVLTMGCDKF